MGGVTPTRFEVTLREPLSRSLLGMIRTRFDHVPTPAGDGTVLVVGSLDQASLRALLTLLWDADHEILALTATPLVSGKPPSGRVVS
jgi:hypothetical protein